MGAERLCWPVNLHTSTAMVFRRKWGFLTAKEGRFSSDIVLEMLIAFL